MSEADRIALEHFQDLLEVLEDGDVETAKEWLRAAIRLLERS
jgi:DNA-binding GntR family transcriptional regulator